VGENVDKGTGLKKRSSVGCEDIPEEYEQQSENKPAHKFWKVRGFLHSYV
jgi:hypothetical protein